MSDIAGGLLDEFFTEKQLADQLHKSGRQVQRMRQQRTGPPWRAVGKTIIYPKVQAREWLHAGVIKPVRTPRVTRSSRRGT
jgi:hypothetical protein